MCQVAQPGRVIQANAPAIKKARRITPTMLPSSLTTDPDTAKEVDAICTSRRDRGMKPELDPKETEPADEQLDCDQSSAGGLSIAQMAAAAGKSAACKQA